MRILIKNVCSGTRVIIEDVAEASISFCEFSMVFVKGHQYSSMEEIEVLLNQMGLSAGNFFFKGVEAWEYDDRQEKGIIFDEDGRTDLLGCIPENLRDKLDFVMLDNFTIPHLF